MNADQARTYLERVLTREGADYAAFVLDRTDMSALIERTFTADESGDLSPQEWADDARRVAAVAAYCEPIHGACVESARPCPEWCEHSGGHPFTHTEPRTLTLVSDDPNDLYQERPALLRIHRRRLGAEPTHAAIELWERAHGFGQRGDSDSIERAALMVGVYLTKGGSGEPHYFTADEARALSEQLRAAADLADCTEVTSKEIIR